ncbi:MAG: hypothetical protein JO130_18250 [Solirubrobacterales bacterium]|nr:hypothetical protein [Solirubrobacterales bacterium]
MLAQPAYFSRIVARLQWDPRAIDFTPDARAWPELADERRERLTRLLCGFRVAETAVAEHLTPFGRAADDTLVTWALFLQRRDEQRHAQLFDRIAAEVVGLAGDAPADRLAAAREHVSADVLELFEERLPAMAAELSAGRAGLGEGVGLYHMLLEGAVFAAGQSALLSELADEALPGVYRGVQRVELDERWHVGFGLRCLVDAEPTPQFLEEIRQGAQAAVDAWGDDVGESIREHHKDLIARRLAVAAHRARPPAIQRASLDRLDMILQRRAAV